MNKYKGPKISLEEVMREVRKAVRERESIAGSSASQGETRTEIQNPERACMSGDSAFTGQSGRGVIREILWKYGTKYAAFIKKVPVIKNLAERYYWKLSGKYNSLYEAFARQEFRLAQQAAQIADMEARHAKRDKTIEDLNHRLSVLSRLEDSLYEELTNQIAEIARQRNEIAGQKSQRKDI